ncbi:class I SAM-dependent methyltransferase [Roseibium sp. TrichSKD4]|uniref:class I SAM-dependent methyltransferase n=1 Tax=Roseibium sp. TrichSKD4 TaxID=744980 RepID=UPI00058DB2DF|nr:class I SAM-dependent methyltransferase [Roseibium sp. TrichSKD4]
MENSRQVTRDSDIEQSIRSAYETEGVYKVDSICHRLNEQSADYVDRLLLEKLKTVRRHAVEGLLVDLCCATGEHLFSLADVSHDCLGIDFSRPYIDKANALSFDNGLNHVKFEVGDAKKIPLATGSVSTLYSFSALYAIPCVDAVISEISRVLRKGGHCVLDLGNSRSLNSICVRAYTELPPTFHISVPEMYQICTQNDLQIVEHRSFQLLPLWADRPNWLWPLLHPAWKKVMAARYKGKMIDEWISSLPMLRNFAFRHLIVCRKL